MERMKRIGIRVVVTFIVSLVSFTNITSAQTTMNKDQSLNAKQQSIVTISAFTAKGDLENLRKALGVTEAQLRHVFDLIEKSVSREQAETARRSLAKVTAARQKKQ